LTDVVSAGRGALELIVSCAQEIFRRAQASLEPFLHGIPPVDAPAPPVGRSTSQGPHEAVEATKFFAGSIPASAAPAGPQATETASLPRAYGMNRAVLTARDPCCLFVWWEIMPVTRVEALRSLGSEAEHVAEVLRLHRGVHPNGRVVADLPLTPGAERWYVEVEPDDTWSVEVGLRAPSGRFVCLVRSNAVASPPAQASDDTSVRWVTMGRQGSAPASAEWSGQWLASDTTTFPSPAPSGSSDALPFR
jgi:hypothetical protein